MNIIKCMQYEDAGAPIEAFISKRNDLCHPAISSNAVDEGAEEWVGPNVLATPIECGEKAFIYKGYATLGALSEDKIWISARNMLTPRRAEAINDYILSDMYDASLDPETWVLTIGDITYPLAGHNAVIISEDGASLVGGPTSSDDTDAFLAKLKTRRKRAKYYADFAVSNMLDFGNTPAEAFQNIQDSGFMRYTPTTFARETSADNSSLAETVDDLVFMSDLVTQAMEYTNISTQRRLPGNKIQTLKQNISKLIIAGLGYPTV
jgi:hypothetical protein